jgi:hypothetical protein
MKRQYLGDSKDSFKWEYLDHLAVGLKSPVLQVAWMMTPDDRSADGQTRPEQFPARPEILELCRHLRSLRDPAQISLLPRLTGASYLVAPEGTSQTFHQNHRRQYFDDLDLSFDQVLFLDPDNGMEPERSFNEKHVRYSELRWLMARITDSSVITVFQHHRRKRFPDDFARIQERFGTGYLTAIYWHSLMFVTVCRSEARIEDVRRVNASYASFRPVEVVG